MDIYLIALTWTFWIFCFLIFSYIAYTHILLLALIIAAYMGLNVYRSKNAKRIHIQDQGVLITGCDSGFGHSLAIRLQDLGFVVYAGVLDIESRGAYTLRKRKSKHLHVVQLDVTNTDDILKTVEFIKQKKSGLWGVVSNAGMNFPGDVEFLTIEQYKKVADVNLYGGIRVVQHTLPLIRQSKGRVVLVSSARGRYSWPGESAYIITKHGIETFADSLRLEMKKFDVNVSVVQPGYFDGATSIMNSFQLQRIESELDQMWDNASNEVKDTYTKQYLDSILQTKCDQMANIRAVSDAPVIDAMISSLILEQPLSRCLVSGSSGGYIDIINVYTVLKPFLPEEISDLFIMYYSKCHVLLTRDANKD